jgi:hypothetical protein
LGLSAEIANFVRTLTYIAEMVESASAKKTEGNGSLWISGRKIVELARSAVLTESGQTDRHSSKSPSIREVHENRIFNRICIIARPQTGFDEAESTVKSQGWLVRGSDLKQDIVRASGLELGGQRLKKTPAKT